MTRLASIQAALSDRSLGSLMAAAQDGDGQAYKRLLAAVAVQAMEACTRDAGRPEYGTAEVEAFACNVLHTVHAALPTFDPRHSFHAWLDAIISVRLAQSNHRQRAQNRRRGGRGRRWYRRLLVQ